MQKNICEAVCYLYKFYFGSLPALGIEAASFASHAGTGIGDGDGILGAGTGIGNRTGFGDGDGDGNGNWEQDGILGAGWRWSEQRYSGKPDGLPERPNQFTINNVQLKVEKWFEAGRNIYKINLELETLNIKPL